MEPKVLLSHQACSSPSGWRSWGLRSAQPGWGAHGDGWAFSLQPMAWGSMASWPAFCGEVSRGINEKCPLLLGKWPWQRQVTKPKIDKKLGKTEARQNCQVVLLPRPSLPSSSETFRLPRPHLLLESQTDPSSLASVDVGKSPNIPYVYVRHHGEVQNYKPLQVVTACSLDIYNFPFDVQNCSLTFTSWLHTSESVGFGRREHTLGVPGVPA